MSDPDLREQVIEAIHGAMPSEMELVSDSDFVNAAIAVMNVYNGALLQGIKKARASLRVTVAPDFIVDADPMVDLVDVEQVNVMIGTLGHHVWVCTEKKTVLRIKAKTVTLDDRRISKENDAQRHQEPQD